MGAVAICAAKETDRRETEAGGKGELKAHIEQQDGTDNQKKQRRKPRAFGKIGLCADQRGGIQGQTHHRRARHGSGKAAHAAVKDEDRGYKEKTEKFRKPLEPGFIEKQQAKRVKRAHMQA